MLLILNFCQIRFVPPPSVDKDAFLRIHKAQWGLPGQYFSDLLVCFLLVYKTRQHLKYDIKTCSEVINLFVFLICTQFWQFAEIWIFPAFWIVALKRWNLSLFHCDHWSLIILESWEDFVKPNNLSRLISCCKFSNPRFGLKKNWLKVRWTINFER